MMQESFLIRIARSWGWRAYVIPVLMVLTVIILFDISTTEDDSAGSGNDTVTSQSGNGRSGPVPGEGYGDGYEGGQLPLGPAFATEPSGNFKDVTVAHPRVGEGHRNAVRYPVEIEDNIDVPSTGGERAFAETVNSILADPRGWTANPDFSFEAAPCDQDPTIVVQLSATGTTHQLCGNTLRMETSYCLSRQREGKPGRVVVSITRWIRGALSFEGDLGLYRQYLINYEVGHGLGYAIHEPCARDGGIAPITMQQTLSVLNDELYEIDGSEVYQVDGKTCSINGWPYPFGADDDTAAPTQKVRQQQTMIATPPNRVLETFGAGDEPHRAGRAWDNGWVYDDSTVLSPVRNSVQALRSAKVRGASDVDGVRVAKSAHTSGGRLVIAGWQACHFIPGGFASRADEAIVAAGRVEESLASIERPQFLLDKEPDYFVMCNRVAWDSDPIGILEQLLDADSVPRTDYAGAFTIPSDLPQLRAEMVVPTEPLQVCHADLVGTLLYDGTAAPVLTDIVPAWRVRGWTAALTAVDCLSVMGADEELLRRFDHLPDFGQLLVRAMCYRFFVHAVSPESQPSVYCGPFHATPLARTLVSK